MGLFNKQNIEYVRQAVLPSVSKTQVGLVLYPQNTTDTTLSISVSSTQVTVTYISSSTQTTSVTYTNRSIEDVCLDINRLGYPIKAVVTMSNTILSSGDLISFSSKVLPFGFTARDRTTSNGVCVRSKKISVRQKSSSQVSILPPYLESPTLPWYPRIQVGTFTQKINNKTYHFSIPEYANQTWSIKYGRPFKDVSNETPIQVSDKIIRLRRSPVFWNGENLEIYKDGTPISIPVEDVDIHNGLVYFKESVISSNITVNYSYKEETYEYKDINLNSHFSQSPQLLDKFVLLYILPFKGDGIHNRKKTVYHVVATSVEEAISSINIEDENIPIAIIGAYSIQQVFASDRSKILDTRVYGGGLNESTGPVSPEHYHDNLIDPSTAESPIESTYIDSNSYWDIGKWDGEIYPGAAAVVMDIPQDLRDAMSVQDIKIKASKFLSAGVYPLFDFSDRELPDVTGWSKQVSCSLTGSIDSTANGILPITYTLPGGLLDETWEEEYTRSIPISSMDNGNVLTVSTTGVYIPYIKSSPIAGIEWEERAYTTNLNSPNDTFIFSPWKKVRSFDTRSVPNHQLIKGNLLFTSNDNAKQYRNIRINSPFQYSEAARLKTKVATLLGAIYTKLLSDKVSSQFGNVTHQYTDISAGHKALVESYIGLHPAYNFVFELTNTDLSETYLLAVGNLFFYSYINSIGLPDIFRPFNPATNSYTNHTTTQTGILFGDHIKSLSKFLKVIKDTLGENYGLYPILSASLGIALNALEPTREFSSSDSDATTIYHYADYKYTFANGGYSGEVINLSETNGGSFSDISSSFEDHNSIKINTALCAAAATFVSPTGSNLLAYREIYKDYHNLIGKNFSIPEEQQSSALELYSSPNNSWKSPKYFATVNGQSTDVYSYSDVMRMYSSFGNPGIVLTTPWLKIGTTDTVNVVISSTGAITQYKIYPDSANTTATIISGNLNITVPKNKSIRVETNGHTTEALHLFTVPPDPEIPADAIDYSTNPITELEASGTLYFPPGNVYNIGRQFPVNDYSRVIIPGGAVVVGSIDFLGQNGAVVEGNGVLVGTFATWEEVQALTGFEDKLDNMMFGSSSSNYVFSNVVKGLTVVAMPVFLSHGGVYKWDFVQCLSPWGGNMDGFSCSHKSFTDPIQEVLNCYAYVGDDGLKAQINMSGSRFLAHNCFITNTAAANILLNYGLSDSPDYSLTTIVDCDMMHFGSALYDTLQASVRSWTDGTSGAAQMQERNNITIKDVRFYGPQNPRLFTIANKVYPWPGKESGDARGSHSNIKFINVSLENTPFYKSELSGYDATNTPHDILFDSVLISGVYLTSGNYSTYVNQNGFPYNVTINTTHADEALITNFGLDYKIQRTFSERLTNNGVDVVDTWFSRHDRLGEYAGTISRDLIEGYEYLVSLHSGQIEDSLYTRPGLDLDSVNDYFKAVASLLYHAKDATYEIITKGGHMPKDMANLIYAYGWYATNYEAHYGVYHGPRIPDYSSDYESLYHIGVDALLKSMVTSDGEIYETDYIDLSPGPFNAYTPSLIFNTLAPGISLDREVYLAKASAVFNTVTGLYYSSGLFYNDPYKVSQSAGGEIPLSYELARLYKAL